MLKTAEELSKEKLGRSLAKKVQLRAEKLAHLKELAVANLDGDDLKAELQRLNNKISADRELSIYIQEHGANRSEEVNITINSPDETPSGALSIQWYNEYLNTGDKKILERILLYNEDDCIATMVIKDALVKMENKFSQ